MQKSYINDITNIEESASETKIIETDKGAKDGQTKCPKCGATDITLNVKSGKLRCNFCRHEFNPEKSEDFEEDISKLKRKIIGSGAQNIIADTKDVLTFKCSSCGAEVIIDTSETTNARCHWCRNSLSVNEQIPNGSVPDMVLPFSITKQDAKLEIEKFVGKRKFFANSTFKKEFTAENVMGVYLPYMVVDVNAHSKLIGKGEHLIRRYTVGSKDSRTTYYDADLYAVEREFDIIIDDLTVESNLSRLDNTSSTKTNNIINSIMPFDIENCVKWDANYIKGYSSEKRDTNIDDLENLVVTQSKDVARFAANDSLKFYDRGVCWDVENLEIIGQSWKSTYLPIWLYSYQQVKGNKKLLHYVAVNARTKETMGSVPIHQPKLFFISFLVEILGLFMTLSLSDFDYSFIFLSLGFIFYFIMFSRYRNKKARHKHELETANEISNLKQTDNFLQTKRRMRNSRMYGANNKSVRGDTTTNNTLIKTLTNIEENNIKNG